MALKLDMMKTYDILSVVIRKACCLIGFSKEMDLSDYGMCLVCISSSFVSFRNIRQGNPLNPYLFVMC